MNNEVEEAKERLKESLDNMLSGLLYSQEDKDKDIKTLLNYIQELEESIYKERELAEAQTTYDINEIWKEKIENRIGELKELLLDPQCAKNVEYRIYELDRLLGKVKNNE